jgi:SAM-dependent methyltransferase
MYDQERAQGEAAESSSQPAATDCWAGQAARFARAASRSEQPDGFMRFVLPRLRATDRVIDIGAGSGRYEPLLAQHVASVLAIEPSAAMLAHLRQQGAANIEVVEARWPDVSVTACDVAISAHVVYGVRELGPFLEAMDRVARRACYLYLAVQHPASFISPFWERIYGAARLPLPGALECLNALYQLGIGAHMALVALHGGVAFADEDEALADIRWRLRLGASTARDADIRAAIADLLVVDQNRILRPAAWPDHAAVIWWERS